MRGASSTATTTLRWPPCPGSSSVRLTRSKIPSAPSCFRLSSSRPRPRALPFLDLKLATHHLLTSEAQPDDDDHRHLDAGTRLDQQSDTGLGAIVGEGHLGR